MLDMSYYELYVFLSTQTLAQFNYFSYLCTMETTIRTYGRTELAQLYFPAICPRAAWAKLRLYMSDYPQLHPLLSNTRRSFLPIEVSLIFDTLGKP
jgi:hypothetical protein